jgi:hypothetical protein
MSDSELNETIPITLITDILVDEVNTEQKNENENIEEKTLSSSSSSSSSTLTPQIRPLRTTKIHKENYKAKVEESVSDVMYSTPDWIYDIKYMTFSGGGVKGYAYTGAILTLDDAFRRKGKN